jgi:hypothetical protein
MEPKLRDVPPPGVFPDRVGKPLPDILEHLGGTVYIQRGDFGEHAEVVDAIHVIGVIMCIEYCVQVRDVGSKRLQAELGSGIDDDTFGIIPDEQG